MGGGRQGCDPGRYGDVFHTEDSVSRNQKPTGDTVWRNALERQVSSVVLVVPTLGDTEMREPGVQE